MWNNKAETRSAGRIRRGLLSRYWTKFLPLYFPSRHESYQALALKALASEMLEWDPICEQVLGRKCKTIAIASSVFPPNCRLSSSSHRHKTWIWAHGKDPNTNTSNYVGLNGKTKPIKSFWFSLTPSIHNTFQAWPNLTSRPPDDRLLGFEEHRHKSRSFNMPVATLRVLTFITCSGFLCSGVRAKDKIEEFVTLPNSYSNVNLGNLDVVPGADFPLSNDPKLMGPNVCTKQEP